MSLVVHDSGWEKGQENWDIMFCLCDKKADEPGEILSGKSGEKTLSQIYSSTKIVGMYMDVGRCMAKWI